ncbi:MAG TPA: threonine synthase [Acidimicrobiales bacterium]|jgi:threonine synthase|nr:threonine synthase [Acidimicrobiales bacterium]
MTRYGGVIARYGELVGVADAAGAVTLLEGATPLVAAPRLSARVGGEVLLKVEGANPTGSFKDRGMTVAITKALRAGSRSVVCASTGNTSASAAAYAGRAGLDCVVVIPEGKVAVGKLAQALVHGARVIQIRGSFDDALTLVRDLPAEAGVTLVNSVNPDRLDGQASAAYEVVDDLGGVPDYLFLPVGNAGNITAYWLGFTRYAAARRAASRPRLHGFQAAGAAPIVLGHVVERPETLATAIQIGNPASWQGATDAVAESGGMIGSVTDEEILEAWRLLARDESVFCEPSSAAGVAGLLKYGVPDGARVVCVLTGNGLKDPDAATSTFVAPPVVNATTESLLGVILGAPSVAEARSSR